MKLRFRFPPLYLLCLVLPLAASLSMLSPSYSKSSFLVPNSPKSPELQYVGGAGAMVEAVAVKESLA
ncbi:MAG: hypothetical protein MUD01_28430, partial [Chloroflexaceae bacterium]|nr:hypothetical protein [Chloroflexaceae bacterium]